MRLQPLPRRHISGYVFFIIYFIPQEYLIFVPPFLYVVGQLRFVQFIKFLVINYSPHIPENSSSLRGDFYFRKTNQKDETEKGNVSRLESGLDNEKDSLDRHGFVLSNDEYDPQIFVIIWTALFIYINPLNSLGGVFLFFQRSGYPQIVNAN